jgi:hypothetical protein
MKALKLKGASLLSEGGAPLQLLMTRMEGGSDGPLQGCPSFHSLRHHRVP